MPLTHTAIQNLKPGPKPLKVFDGRGLYMEVSPSGGKWWRLKYRFNGKEKRLSLGVYPDVSLKMARDWRQEARILLAERIDPSENRKTLKKESTENSFEVVAQEWYDKYSSSWAEDHGNRILRRLERDVFPWIGNHPIWTIIPGVDHLNISLTPLMCRLDSKKSGISLCLPIVSLLY